MIKNSLIGAEATTIQPPPSTIQARQKLDHITEVIRAEEAGQVSAQVSRGDLDPAEVRAVGEPTVGTIGKTTSDRTLHMDMIRIGVVTQIMIGKGKDFLRQQRNPIQNPEGNLHLRTQ